MERNISPLLSLRHTLMADRVALPLLRPLLQTPSIHLWRFQNSKSSPSPSHLLHFYSVKVIPLNRRIFRYRINAAMDNGGGYGRMERRKKGKKQRELWEQLLEDNFEEEDDDDGSGNSDSFDLWKILEEIVDNVWILKAFKSYGYLLPFILLSLFFSTGPKAFLVSLAVAIVPSLLFYAFQKLIGWDKRRVTTSMANQFGVEEEVKRRSRTTYKSSSVRNDDNGRSVNLGSAETASTFGGWDDGLGIEQPRNETRRKPMKKKRKKIRREEAAEPLLLRLLVSLFPFLSSYTNMLK